MGTEQLGQTRLSSSFVGSYQKSKKKQAPITHFTLQRLYITTLSMPPGLGLVHLNTAGIILSSCSYIQTPQVGTDFLPLPPVK